MKIPELSVQGPEKLPRGTFSDKNAPKAINTADTVHRTGRRTESQRLPADTVRSSPALASGLLKSLKLPVDQLSNSIVSFAKFFSLPLEPVMLANIRALSFMPQPARGRSDTAFTHAAQNDSGAPGNETDAEASGLAVQKSREALALAALASADKGANLSQTALEEYAAAIDPEQQSEHGKGRQNNREQPDSGEQANGSSQTGAQKGKQLPLRENTLSPVDSPLSLKELFIDSSSEKPALDFLNRIPGRNGQRWLAFPLCFTENGVLYRITLRILLDRGMAGNTYPVRRMSLDILKSQINETKAEQRWLFIFDRALLSHDSSAVPDSPCTGDTDKFRLAVLVRPSQPPEKLKPLARKISEFLDIPTESIVTGNFKDSDFAEDSRNDVLLSINKEV